MDKFKVVFDDYFGEWVLIDRSIWYKTKYLTYPSHIEAIKAYNKKIKIESA